MRISDWSSDVCSSDRFAAALTPFNVALALGGVAAGTIVGSLPGLTATMAVAVLVPLTFAMEPSSALILMGAIYTGAIYGGAYAAVLLKFCTATTTARSDGNRSAARRVGKGCVR